MGSTLKYNIRNQPFGKLVAKKHLGQGRWLCVCKCGGTWEGDGSLLRRHRVKSCGCSTAANISAAKTKHGHARVKTRTYMIWASMWRRCTKPSSKQYKDYGGRGITVCKRWKSFTNFLADMGPVPSPKHTLDRKENNADYTPTNCRWATRVEQNRNKRSNVFVEYNGHRRCLAEWQEVTGIHYTTISYRLKSGWPIKKALTTPPHTRNRR